MLHLASGRMDCYQFEILAKQFETERNKRWKSAGSFNCVHFAIASKNSKVWTNEKKIEFRIKVTLLSCNWQQMHCKNHQQIRIRYLINSIATVIAVGHF